VLGEDIGAQLGLLMALGFLVLASVTGDPSYDAMGSICIGVILIFISVFVAWRIKGLLVGRSADPEIQEAIDEIIGAHENIEHVFNIITMQFGPDTMLAAKLRINPEIGINDAIKSINHLERELKKRVPNLRWCFIEPDISD
jgi:divalent metal cation (Fe/Co/Zn/Cd) transporter